MSIKISKRKTKTEAYQIIYVEGKSHQVAFEALREKTVLSAERLADIIAGMPSQKQYQDKKPFWVTLIVALSLVILLRSLGVIALVTQISIGTPFIALAVFTGVGIPIAGIYAAANGRVHWFRWIGFFLFYGIIRNLTRETDDVDVLHYVVLSFFGITGIGAMYFPSLFKTKYKKSVKSIEADVTLKKEVHFIFEEHERINNDELLDTL